MFRRHPIAIAILVVIVLALPSLTMPFISDDYFHVLMIEDHLGLRSGGTKISRAQHDVFGSLNLYAFFSFGPEGIREMVSTGEAPWWTSPELRTSFWRPLASAVSLLDYRVFGRNPLGWHMHALAWYLALVTSVGLLYRRALGPSTSAPASEANTKQSGVIALSAVATLLYAVDEIHWLPMAWLANRHALVAAVPALLGLLAHMRWREQQWTPGLPLSVLGYAIGLAGSEAALGVFGYLFAYELFGARTQPLTRRLVALVPGALVGLSWLLAYRAMGYGSGGSGLYLDPLRDLGPYLLAMTYRIPLLVGATFGGLPSDASLAVPQLIPALAGFGVFAMAVAALLTRAIWPTLPPETRHGLRWLIVGAGFAMAPVLTTFPLDRLMLLPSIGITAVIALVLRHCFTLGKGWRWKSFGVLTVLAHLIYAPFAWVMAPQVFDIESDSFPRMVETAFPDDDAPPRRVFVACASDLTVALYLPNWAEFEGRELAKAWYIGSAAPGDHRLTRVDARTLELEVLDGGLDEGMLGLLFRGPTDPLAVGDEIEQVGVRARVLEVGEAGASRMAFEFDQVLEQGEFRFLTWRDGELQPLALPAIGEVVDLPWSPGPRGL